MEVSAGEDEEPRSVRWPRCLGVAELAKPGLYQARAALLIFREVIGNDGNKNDVVNTKNNFEKGKNEKVGEAYGSAKNGDVIDERGHVYFFTKLKKSVNT
jgi:hypothetical protein